MRLSEIMSSPVETVPTGTQAEDAWQRMRMKGIRHLVVLGRGLVAGVVSDGDLGGAKGADARRGRTVAEMMARTTVTASPGTTLRDAANLLRGRAAGCLPVLERGRLVGIVTLSDVLDLLGRGAAKPQRRSLRQKARALGRPGPVARR